MKKIIFAAFVLLFNQLCLANDSVGMYVGEGLALSREKVSGRCIEWQEAKASDQVVGTVAGTAVGGGLGAALGKAVGGKTGTLVGGVVGAGAGAAAGSSIASERKCLKRDAEAYEYLVSMTDGSLIRVVQANFIVLGQSMWSPAIKPTKVKVYRFPDQSFAIVLVD